MTPPDPLSPARLTALKALCEQATPGPWSLRPHQYDNWGWLRAADGKLVASTFFESRVPDGWRESTRYDSDEWRVGPPEVAANAAFIMELVNALPALLHAAHEAPDLQPLKDSCDRSWDDETPQQVIVIAANGLYFRDREIEALRTERDAQAQRAETAEQERDAARATATKLNRTLTRVVPAVEDNLEACRRAGQSFGRRLSGAGYALERGKRIAAEARADRAEQENAQLRNTVEFLSSPPEVKALIGSLAEVKHELHDVLSKDGSDAEIARLEQEGTRLRAALNSTRTWLVQVGAGNRETGPYNQDEGAGMVLTGIEQSLGVTADTPLVLSALAALPVADTQET